MSELSRLRWRCRRGIKEMDLILQYFLEHDYPTLSSEDKTVFDEILDETDLDILDWVLDRAEPDRTEYKTIIKLFRQRTPN
ncbi:MAG: antitoxin CptB [Planctomycetota bacterium]|jgi:antitoxin CptB